MTTNAPAHPVHEAVRERYAEVARSGGMATARAGCCGTPDAATVSARLGYSREDLAAIPESANLGVGCGAPLAHAALKEGETVLDLGSGAGMDAFLAARDVGPKGRVIGVDMTPEMIEKATRNAAAAGFDQVEFRAGLIENLPVDDASVDAVISNCVINLAPDKSAVFAEVARVLRPGGRMVVSDVVLEAPLPDFLLESIAAWTGCVAGAVPKTEYLDVVAAAGLVDVEIVEERGFGEVIFDMAPADLLEQAKNLGIDPVAVAATVKSIKVRARRPG